MTTTDARQLALDWINAWISGDLSLLKLDPAFSHSSPFGTLEGRDHYLSIIVPASKKNVTELKLTGVLAEGDQAVVRYDMSTQHGTTAACDWVFVSDGLIRRIISYYDKGAIQLSYDDDNG